MSDDLVQRIAYELRRYELNNGTLSGAFDRAKASRAIASLIAEARASARREALEEAARWHRDQRIKGSEVPPGQMLARMNFADIIHHETSERAIRSLAAKEATNGQ